MHLLTSDHTPWPGSPTALLCLVQGKHSHGPAFSRGHSEERQQSPEDVVIVEVIFLPLPGLGFHLLLLIIQILAPGNSSTEAPGHRPKVQGS